MKILIGADLVPTESNCDTFINGNMEKILDKKLLSVLQNADYKIFNLETPLADKKSPIEKYGPNLIAPTSTINGIKKIGVDFFTCANNHILDQGKEGLDSTVKVLNKNNINFSGIGDNLKDAQKPFVFRIGDKNVGVYCCAEHEFSIATNSTPGANPYDPLYSFDHIKQLKNDVDYVIVLYHGGKEHYRYPSPKLQEVCHKFVDSGANLIICQHSHCIGCEEKYNGATIIYGQGNFIFDLIDNEYWNSSLLVEIDTNNFDISYVPLEKIDGKIKISSDPKIMGDFYLRSNQIKDRTFVEQNYCDFAKSIEDIYLLAFYGYRSFFKKVLNKITFGGYYKHLVKKQYKKHNNIIQIKNYLECETHYEIINCFTQKNR